MEQITGSVARLVFRNPENTYTVLRLAPKRERRRRAAPGASAPSLGQAGPDALPGSAGVQPHLPKLVTVVGDFAAVEVGQQLWVSGEWTEHPFHGRQFRADRWKVELPTTLAGMQAYLASGMVRGIGPSLATAIVDAFQEHTFDIIESEPQRLREVAGIGENRVKVITTVWQEQSAIRNLMAFLQSHDLPPNLAIKIYKALGPAAPQVVQSELRATITNVKCRTGISVL